MLHPLACAALGTVFTFALTTLGAAAVFFLPKGRQGGSRALPLGFAAGVMTAASLWSLLLPCIEQVRTEGKLPPWLPPVAGILLGAVFLAVLDALMPRLIRFHPGEGETGRRNALLFSAITLHNIPEGMAVGLAFALADSPESFCAAAALALGIGIQNFPEGAAISLPLWGAGYSRGRAFLRGSLSGAVEPVFGILAALAAARGRTVMPWLLSFAAGAMLYVVVEELLPEARSRWGTWGFLAGFLLMMALDVALG